MTRRRLDTDTKWRIVQHEAYRTFGRKHYRVVIFGPYMARVLTLAAAVAGLMALWVLVPHALLGVAAIILAVAVVIGYLAVTGSRSSVQSRMIARAKGQRAKPGMGLGWAASAAAVMLGAVGWLSLWSPWA
jgi:hypothetical protein